MTGSGIDSWQSFVDPCNWRSTIRNTPFDPSKEGSGGGDFQLSEKSPTTSPSRSVSLGANQTHENSTQFITFHHFSSLFDINWISIKHQPAPIPTFYPVEIIPGVAANRRWAAAAEFKTKAN